MFGFLKKKLKEAVDSITKKAEKEADVVEEVEEKIEEKVEEKKDEVKEIKKEKPKEEKQTKKEEKREEKPKKEDIPPPKEKKEAKPQATIEKEKPEEIVEKVKEEKPVEKKVEKKEVEPEPTKKDKEKVEETKDKIKEEPPTLKETQVETKEEIKEEPLEEEKEKPPQEPEPEEKKGFFQKYLEKKEEKVEDKTIEETPALIEEPQEVEEKEEIKKEVPKAEEEKVEEEDKSFLGKVTGMVTKVSLSEQKFDELFWELELILLENNVAVEVIEKIKGDLKQDLVEKKINRKNLETEIFKSLKKSIESLFDIDQIDLIKNAKNKKPYVIAMIGVNGAGKTTTLAKLVHLLKENNLEPVVAACDTFRAAAIQQLEEHTDKLGVKIIKHDYGSDPAAVAFDAVKHAEAKGKDVVLIDTAGRLHSNKNLMQELEKVIRVAKPDLRIFVGESIAGNDVVEQVKLFNEKVGIDAIILSKADIDEKGGAAISVSFVTGKPIIYLATGQNYEDLEKFDKNKIMKQLGLA